MDAVQLATTRAHVAAVIEGEAHGVVHELRQRMHVRVAVDAHHAHGIVESAPRPAQRLNRYCNDWLLRGCKRTFSPFHRGVVTSYALEVGAAGEGDNRDASLSAFGAVRYPIIHEIPPDFFTRSPKL
jgi:hypothetical protein